MREPLAASGVCSRLDSKMGIEVMSVNMLLENETDPVIWRGPIIADVVKQFWTDCNLERCGLHVRGYASRNR